MTEDTPLSRIGTQTRQPLTGWPLPEVWSGRTRRRCEGRWYGLYGTTRRSATCAARSSPTAGSAVSCREPHRRRSTSSVLAGKVRRPNIHRIRHLDSGRRFRGISSCAVPPVSPAQPPARSDQGGRVRGQLPSVLQDPLVVLPVEAAASQAKSVLHGDVNLPRDVVVSSVRVSPDPEAPDVDAVDPHHNISVLAALRNLGL